MPASSLPRIPPGQIQTTKWPVLHYGDVPTIDTSKWTFRVSGLVERPFTLTYDEFGNLRIDAHTKDPDAPVAAREVNMVTFSGRAVIDVPRSELRLMALTGNVDPNEVLSPERRRRFEVTDDTLKLSSMDERGDVTAISTWRRRK